MWQKVSLSSSTLGLHWLRKKENPDMMFQVTPLKIQQSSEWSDTYAYMITRTWT